MTQGTIVYKMGMLYTWIQDIFVVLHFLKVLYNKLAFALFKAVLWGKYSSNCTKY